MRIFHILPDKTTVYDDQNFLAFTESFAALGFHQAAVIRQDDVMRHALEQSNIHITAQKFGGIFDLRTKKTIQAEISAFKPHLVQAYGLASLDFVKDIPATCPFVPVLDRNEISDPALLQQTAPHAILVGYKSSEEALSAVTETPPVLPPLLRAGPPRVSASHDNAGTFLPALPENAYIAGFTGPLTEGLALDPVLQAIREIPAFHFLIYGTGDKERYFKDMACKRGVHDRVHFITPGDNPAAFYKPLDLVIIPSHKQDTLRSLLQAWNNRLPVLVCDDAANTPVDDKQTGRIAPPHDIFGIRHILREIIETPEDHANMAAAGKTLFEQRYAPQIVLSRYLKFYKGLLSA